MAPWDSQRIRPAASSREIRPSYVLVADAHVDRAAACLESIRPFGIEARVARDGDQALDILRQSGPPALLITDLALGQTDGFGVIEALRASDHGRTQIIAWSSSPELREFAAQRLAGLNVRVLGGAVAPDVLRGTVERALQRSLGADDPSDSPEDRAARDIDETMTELSARARKLSGAAGVAVYWKAAGETRFRASVTWTSETPMPQSPYHLPRVFGWILETGEALVLPDLTAQHLSDVSTSSVQDVVRGLVAVPIVGADREIVGTICVFDLKPLTFGDEVVEALKELGRQGLPQPSADQSSQAAEPSVAAEPLVRPVHDVVERPLVRPAAAPLDRRDGTLMIARELARMRREQRPISVIAFVVSPIDQATEPGPTGSSPEVVGAVGETLARGIRASDLAVRWSGGELLLVLPGLGATEARQVAERVRAAMQAGARYGVAVSGGVAELHPDESFESVVARANEKVQLARERGHNRVA